MTNLNFCDETDDIRQYLVKFVVGSVEVVFFLLGNRTLVFNNLLTVLYVTASKGAAGPTT